MVYIKLFPRPSFHTITHRRAAATKNELYFQTLSALLFLGGGVGNQVIKKLQVQNGPVLGVLRETQSQPPMSHLLFKVLTLRPGCIGKEFPPRTHTDVVISTVVSRGKQEPSQCKLNLSFQRRRDKRTNTAKGL